MSFLHFLRFAAVCSLLLCRIDLNVKAGDAKKPASSTAPMKQVLKAAPIPELTAEEHTRIDKAVQRGVSFLQNTQLQSGTWIVGKAGRKLNPLTTGGAHPSVYPVGFAALVGLTLLECGNAKTAPEIERAARYVRSQVATLYATYEVSTALMFLDRIGDKKDGPLIRTLAVRLAGGQTALGGWGYACPILSPAEEEKAIQSLNDLRFSSVPKLRPPHTVKQTPGKPVFRDNADNSNTQFALLALWTARRHGVAVDCGIALAAERFRASYDPRGWSYRFDLNRPYGAMTCAGVIALAMGHGVSAPSLRAKDLDEARTENPLLHGLRAVAVHMEDPTDYRNTDPTMGPKGTPSYYFLWSVERVGVVCSLDTIGGKDWYRWGVNLILPSQQANGSWLGRGSWGFPVADTCFALLFLKRSNLLPDLRESLERQGWIMDPGATPSSGENSQSSSKKSESKSSSQNLRK